MSALTSKQRKKFEEIRRNKGADAAKSFRDGIVGGGSGGRSRGGNLYGAANKAAKRVKLGDVGSVANSQRRENIVANQLNAPDQSDYMGSRNVTFDRNGQATVNTQLNSEQQRLFDQQNDYRSGVNSFVNAGMGSYQGFNPGAYQDPRAQSGQYRNAMHTIPQEQRGKFSQPFVERGIGDANNIPQRQGFEPGTYQDPKYQMALEGPVFNSASGRGQNFGAQVQNFANNTPQGQGIPDYGQINNDVSARAMAMYERNTNDGIATARQAEIQQLINSGNAPGSPRYKQRMDEFERNAQNSRLNAQDQAYISGQQATNAAYDARLRGNQQGFDQGFATNKLNFDQRYATNQQEFDQGFATNQQRFDQGFAVNQQRFDQDYMRSMAPIEAMRPFLPYAGQFTAPNFGPIKQFDVAPVNTGGLAAGYYSTQQDNAGRLGAAGISAGATLGSAGISAGAALEAQRMRGEQALDQIAAGSVVSAGF
jgi:hypothetical protein